MPADSLIRTERPPNKEILRYFIRHNALRAGTGENAPWVVEDELVKKYSLPSKFSDFLLDPYKVSSLPIFSQQDDFILCGGPSTMRFVADFVNPLKNFQIQLSMWSLKTGEVTLSSSSSGINFCDAYVI